MRTHSFFISFLILFSAFQCLSQTSFAQTEPAIPLEQSMASDWSIHFQITTVTQTHFKFNSPYSGPNSLQSKFEIPSSLTSTLYVGHRLWTGASVFVNPEESMGAGLSHTEGIAAFPNGEIYRVDDPNPVTNLSRFFVQQDFELGGGKEKEEGDLNQFQDLKDVDRLKLVMGKFSLNDYFDDNAYSHDPRSQFLNWVLMDAGAWDYAADTRGYTWGLMTDLHLKKWSFRFALVQVPQIANGEALEGDLIHAHSENIEAEYRYKLGDHPGKIRMLAYANEANMGNYQAAIQEGLAKGTPPDITQTRTWSTKYGFGFNLEQEINSDLGVFSRLSWNDGHTETWAFTEVDRALSVGLSLKGTSWNRGNDTIGLALIVDGLSSEHEAYLKAGGIGFLVGDGTLNYEPEEVMETYYSYQVIKPLSLTLDFQGVNHPGYNADRGPVPIFAFRAHYEI